MLKITKRVKLKEKWREKKANYECTTDRVINMASTNYKP
jgi:hypothetical protein